MKTEEKIEKTVNSIKQKTFGKVDEYWLHAFEQGMRVAIEAEEMEYKERTCGNCKHYKESYLKEMYCYENVDLQTFHTPDFGCNKWTSK